MHFGNFARAGLIATATGFVFPQIVQAAEPRKADFVEASVLPHIIQDGVDFAAAIKCGSAREKRTEAMRMIKAAKIDISLRKKLSHENTVVQANIIYLNHMIDYCMNNESTARQDICKNQAKATGLDPDRDENRFLDYVMTCDYGLQNGFNDLTDPQQIQTPLHPVAGALPGALRGPATVP